MTARGVYWIEMLIAHLLHPAISVSTCLNEQAPGGKMTSYSREEVETYLEIFNSVADAMGACWKEGDAGLAVERRLLADLTSIIQDF